MKRSEEGENQSGNEPPTIVFFGLFGGTNLGNEATLAAVISNLRERRPEIRITCVAPRGSPVGTLHGAELIEMDQLPVSSYLWRIRNRTIRSLLYRMLQLVTEVVRSARSRRAVRGADLFVVPGTGIADDFGQGPLDLPLHLYRWCTAARRSMPISIVSIGAGPAHHPISRTLIRKALKTASLRSYRDTQSREFATRLGIDTRRDAVAPDLAFSLPPDRLPAFGPASWPPREIGIGVMGYRGWNESESMGETIYREYVEKIKTCVLWLLDRGQSVRLLIGDTRSDEAPRDELIAWRDSLPDRTQARRIRWEPILTVSDVLREIGATDAIVASRFHNVVLALLLGKPTISLGYDEKNNYVMREMGLGEYCLNIERFDPGTLSELFAGLESNVDPAMQLARHRITEFRCKLDGQYDELLHQLAI